MWTPEDSDPSEWRYKRRGTVLGLWHSIKQDMWEHHKEMCDGSQGSRAHPV